LFALEIPKPLKGQISQIKSRAMTVQGQSTKTKDQMQNSKKICHNRFLRNPARVVKLVDAGDSKSPAARRAGSIPASGTIDLFQVDTLNFAKCIFF
jgi:hypothetical protein